MIAIRIYGGLGNQMFQYAAGRALALRHGVPLKLDLRWMRRYRNQPLLITRLPIQKTELNWHERLAYTGFPFPRHPPYPFFRWVPYFWHRVYMERSYGFEDRFTRLGPDHFLFGRFQSYRYFSGYESVLRDDFRHQLNPALYDEAVIEMVRKPNAVAVQFRRGDYVTDAATGRYIGVCPMDYYRRAAEIVCKRINSPQFLVFSDDIEWCRRNVDLDGAVFVERKNGTAVDDMALAAQCRHIILANSTFSWWCAWLRAVGDGITIAPERWFRDELLNQETSELCPSSWMRI